jgi:hypothetical protein
MSIHDQMALNARLEGQTSAQYHRAAQRHANAMWIYIIIAGIVWYFTNWIWALIPFALAALVAIQSISATLIAQRLEKYESREAGHSE